MAVPLAVEVAAARGVAALSRLVGAGGGTTVPGKLLAILDPGAVDRLAARPATEALEELRRAAGTQFCPRCVAALERILPIEGFDDEQARQHVLAAS